MNYGLLVLFAALLALGQVLFKKAALAGAAQDFPWAFCNVWMGLAIVLYGAATLLWTWILRTTPLSAAYPFAGLAFVIVPLLGALFFGEEIGLRVLLGAALIMAGIIVSSG